jgi:CubicO group peptidase (beta-lactamase class C family)
MLPMRITLLIAGLAVFCMAAWSPTATHAQTTDDVRVLLTYEDLNGTRGELLHNDYFMPVGEPEDALHELVGRLSISPDLALSNLTGWPGFDVQFFTSGRYLVPVERDIIRSSTSNWDIILSPGTVWSEPSDRGWSRASFPFVLTGKRWNESHNGLATFLFNDTEVSSLRVQIVQEAAEWAQFDAWAILPMEYSPQRPENLDALRAEFTQSQEQRTPIRAWSELEIAAVAEPRDGFDGEATHVTTSGLVVDGVLYAHPCSTRHGDYPYCQEMRHGVYSVTKSAGAALALFWLAHVYGDEVFALRIADYLDVTADHDGWEEVTFAHVLNMMTGVGDNAPQQRAATYDFEDDEDDENFAEFAAAEGALAKLDVAFSAGNYPWGPGQVGRYNTIQTFVLSAAMDAFLKSREGPDAYLWDHITDFVLAPLGIVDAPMMHTREADGSRGVPILGWGYYPTLGEITKVAQLFQDNGAYEGRQLIDADWVQVIQLGLQAPAHALNWENEYGKYRYYMSFWYLPFRGEAGCQHSIPQMNGLGGNLVTLMPNGMIGIRLADGEDDAPGTYNAENMAVVADRLRSFCDG